MMSGHYKNAEMRHVLVCFLASRRSSSRRKLLVVNFVCESWPCRKPNFFLEFLARFRRPTMKRAHTASSACQEWSKNHFRKRRQKTSCTKVWVKAISRVERLLILLGDWCKSEHRFWWPVIFSERTLSNVKKDPLPGPLSGRSKEWWHKALECGWWVRYRGAVISGWILANWCKYWCRSFACLFSGEVHWLRDLWSLVLKIIHNYVQVRLIYHGNINMPSSKFKMIMYNIRRSLKVGSLTLH